MKKPYQELTKPMKISFYFKNSQTPRLATLNRGTIYYYLIENNRKSKEKSTFIECYLSEWNGNDDCFVGKDSDQRNDRIEEIGRIIRKNKQISEVLGNPISINELIEMNVIDNRHKITFLELFDLYVKSQKDKIRQQNQLKHKGNIEQSTFDSYEKRRKNFCLFLTANNKMTLPCNGFDIALCGRFDTWLTSGGKRGQGYATKHIKLVRTVVLWGEINKYILCDTTKGYKMKHPARKRVITFSSMDYQKITDIYEQLSATEQKYIDVLIFLKESTLSISDYRELITELHLKKIGDKCFLIKPRKKRQEENNQIQVIPLSKVALELINKYGSLETMPRTVDTCINKYIKIAFLKAGITQKVSTKHGRSSGVSIAYNEQGIRADSIMMKAGWTSTNQIHDYLQIDIEKLHEEFLGVAS